MNARAIPPQQRPAKKVSRSCVHCKQAHVSCSHVKPCRRCVERGLDCVEATPKRRRNAARDSSVSPPRKVCAAVAETRMAPVVVGTRPWTASVQSSSGSTTPSAFSRTPSTSSILSPWDPFGDTGMNSDGGSSSGSGSANFFFPPQDLDFALSMEIPTDHLGPQLTSFMGLPPDISQNEEFLTTEQLSNLLLTLREFVKLRREMLQAEEAGDQPNPQTTLHLKGMIALLREKMAEIRNGLTVFQVPVWEECFRRTQESMSTLQHQVSANVFFHGAVPTALWEIFTANKNSLQTCNQAFREVFQLSWNPEVVSQSDEAVDHELPKHMLKFEELIHPDDLDRVLHSFHCLFEDGFRGDRVVTGKCTFVTLQTKEAIEALFVSHYFRRGSTSDLLCLNQIFPTNVSQLIYSSANPPPCPGSCASSSK